MRSEGRICNTSLVLSTLTASMTRTMPSEYQTKLTTRKNRDVLDPWGEWERNKLVFPSSCPCKIFPCDNSIRDHMSIHQLFYE